mgnify:CR=1 FL=1
MTSTDLPASDAITALLLAGGRGSRMGGVDKGLQNYHGTPLALNALSRLRAQTLPPHRLMVNANRHLGAYAALGVGSLDIGKSCIRFHHPAKIPYELITELCGRISVDRYVAAVEHAMAARQVKTKTKAGKPRSGDTASSIQQ